ncbi:MAG: histidine phosphatase family protein [Bacteroidales bacterium]|nr:histidine phosphatase family protein [Bacteroidales bacterium]
MTTLFLTRHGQTEENVAHIFQGHLPGHLTALGKQQAIQLGEELRHYQYDVVVSSDLQRCIDTVRLALGDPIPWYQTSLLREIDWGIWTGKSYPSIAFRNQLTDNFETYEGLYRRAQRFLDYLHRQFEGQRVLAVGHGIINRHIQACILHIPLSLIDTIPLMRNVEIRTFTL